MTVYWEGRKLELQIFFSWRFLMFATDTVLSVDGQEVARKGGIGVSETAIGYFHHQGSTVRAELQVKGGIKVFTMIPYTLRLDGTEVSSGQLRLERLPAAIAFWSILAGLLTRIMLLL